MHRMVLVSALIGCGAQGLNQGLNLRDSGLNVSYTLRPEAIQSQRQSWKNASVITSKLIIHLHL